MSLKNYKFKDLIEVGCDEAGRGCLAGPVFAGVVIMPKKFDEDDTMYTKIKDSKKLSHKKRVELSEYIKKVAVDWKVAMITSDVIDEINILQATFKAMHKALDGLTKIPEHIIVDGPLFKPYLNKKEGFIPHKCIKGGDNKYLSIAAAGILAKVSRDKYILELCEENEELNQYGWDTNKAYGTKKHRDAIIKYGLTKYHRRSFGICKRYC